MINYLLLLAALCITTVSGYVSIMGLTSIFSSPSSYYIIIAIASSFEVAKVLSTSWLHSYWTTANLLLRSYLTTMIILLIFLNAISSFGFLSKSHIDEMMHINSGGEDDIAIVQNKIDSENQAVNDLNTQIAQIDASISKLTDTGKAVTSINIANAQRKTRDALVKQKDTHVQNISTYTQQRIRLQGNVKRLEAEVGPIKYIAQVVYGNADNDQLEKAVRLLTMIIVGIFDPLAVVLLIAANVGLNAKKTLTKSKKHDILVVDNNVFESKDAAHISDQ